MANQEHLLLLKQGINKWNRWRKDNRGIQPDLSEADLRQFNFSDADLVGANLSMANLEGAKLRKANLTYANLTVADLRDTDLCDAALSLADLRGADLRCAKLINSNLLRAVLSNVDLCKAELSEANLSESDLSNAWLREACLRKTRLRETYLIGANLHRANFEGADLTGANLRDSDLSNANLNGAILDNSSLVKTNLCGAVLTGCSVYGISVWDAKIDNKTDQSELIITPRNESPITVDNLKMAQFIYLLLNNEEIRDVINTIGQKGVLILGRFSKERKPVLDALREKLRTLNFLPIVFDFERSAERDITETIKTLAGLCCFIIADITNPKSSPLELQATVPDYMIPFVPLIQKGEQPFSMFRDLQGKYDWVLDVLVYDTLSHLIEGLKEAVVKPALEKRAELLVKKVKQVQMKDIRDFLK